MEATAKPDRGRHPLMKRLPLLALVGLGLWLWQATEPPERELVWQLDGSGWSTVRGLDFQLTGDDGKILKREEHFFSAAPPSEVRLKVDLPEGSYRALIFVKEQGQPARPPLVEALTIGENPYILKTLRLPASR
ncbi:hypothetical protein POL68_04045 [Stigmatella sp. ncwal1]|uniref:Uncharacterized protein n=1 Tax=Stigmatella ashevillensis TaxID=2995309 RepID=A0ABT5D1V3_9BACT|nr:hypothetical protein [Stigmatella ashevillena]MDC0707632.1 hypothetical protein [Stigmatella ashevillena]